jgi:hypothetical protein
MVLRQELGIESLGSIHIVDENMHACDSKDAWALRFILCGCLVDE